MNATRDSSIAARVPLNLRADLELIVSRDGEADLSVVIRKALRRYADERLGRTPAGAAGIFEPAQGAARRRDRSTSTAAAIDVAPRTGSQRRKVLNAYGGAGARGLTADEVMALLEAAGARVVVNGIARRVTDLLQAGAIEALEAAPCGHDELDAVEAGARIYATRPTRNGSAATVYVITAKGRAWLEADRQERAA